MRVPEARRGATPAGVGAWSAGLGEAEVESRPTFEAVYRRYFDECCRWLRAMGAPDSDLEDLAQEVFVVVQRKLGGAPIENLPGWIYRIGQRTISDHRRRAWWKNLLGGRHVHTLDLSTCASAALDPAEALEVRRRAALAQRLLERLPLKQRVAIVLFEIEGYSGQEIAALEGVPLQTVWARLHYARRKFIELAEVQRRLDRLGQEQP